MTSKNPLIIEIKNTHDSYIEVRNNIQQKISNEQPTGFGLDLLKKRYALMNIEKGIMVENTKDQFVVKLKLVRQ